MLAAVDCRLLLVRIGFDPERREREEIFGVHRKPDFG
jgi:hypothetical protein